MVLVFRCTTRFMYDILEMNLSLGMNMDTMFAISKLIF